ncbi:hypothetical protein K6Y31_20915 [Motilimonas cestriensis]|uniref:DUF2523 domain-containing protein n=1 Tax=Motilimonas cestriensis TaxID=2742685 RepID=A0ABS8WDW5_9GAMM|nr:hypothetical protein [Motilimonas cestriensis]MCE2597239.1 hypothetical protein [Motilimonas cestriensis]
MKYIFFTLFLFSASAFAADEVTALEQVMQNLQDIADFFTIGIPDLVSRVIAYAIEFAVYLKVLSFVFMLELATDVAKHIMLDLNLTAHINTAFSSIPPDIGYFLIKFRFPDCVSFLFECYITRFVLNFLGW